MGPDRIAARYDAPATALQWYEPHAGDVSGWCAVVLKVIGKLLDPFRTWAWVRRHDVVIVPGMGVLEATLPLRPWAFPYSLFWLGLTARLTGTRVALVSVGANVVTHRVTRWFIVQAARLAHYRSFRDEQSREAMRDMGVDVASDSVYPDLAFGLPVPETRSNTGAVGVGVMAYHGGNDDRPRADELHREYVETITWFVDRLLNRGHDVCLVTGDQADLPVVAQVLARLNTGNGGFRDGRVRVEPASTMAELLKALAGVDVVVASRYHNVLGGLLLGKPTLSIGYAAKHDALMATVGMQAFCQRADSIDRHRLIEQFDALQHDADALTAALQQHRRELGARVHDQLDELDGTLVSVDQRNLLAELS